MDHKTISKGAGLFKETMTVLLKNDPLQLAGATAFFTTFALPAILVIILQISGVFLDARNNDYQLFQKLTRFVGRQSALQLINSLHAFRGMANTVWVAIAGFVFLIFVATTLFKVIRDSLNKIWDVKPNNRTKLSQTLAMRLRSLLVIVFAGLLFLITIMIEGFQSMVRSGVQPTSIVASIVLNRTIAYLISIVIVTVWFSLIFYFLPDARPSWKIGAMGACVTAILFTIGKIVLRWLLLHSNISKIFGTSASIALLLLFVFYSSMIFYFGAAFTKVLATHLKQPIRIRSRSLVRP